MSDEVQMQMWAGKIDPEWMREEGDVFMCGSGGCDRYEVYHHRFKKVELRYHLPFIVLDFVRQFGVMIGRAFSMQVANVDEWIEVIDEDGNLL